MHFLLDSWSNRLRLKSPGIWRFLFEFWEEKKFVKKSSLAQVFSCEFCEISKNTFLTEHLWATASRIDTETYLNTNEAYKALLERFLVLYDKYFPLSLKCKISVIWLIETVCIFLIFLMWNARKLGGIYKVFEFILT